MKNFKDLTFSKLVNIFIKIFNLNKKKISTKQIANITEKNFEKWDSIHKLNLLIVIEQEFKIKIKNNQAEKLNSFQEALKIIKSNKKNEVY